MDTLILNGSEVRVKPVSLDVSTAKPMKNKIDLPCGPVIVNWPGLAGTMTIQASYQNLDEEDAEAMLILSTRSGTQAGKNMPSHVMAFSRKGPWYQTKTIRCELTESEGQNGWSVNLTAVMNWMPV